MRAMTRAKIFIIIILSVFFFFPARVLPGESSEISLALKDYIFGGEEAKEKGEAVGFISSLKGRAIIISVDGSKRPAKVRMRVFRGDRIETDFRAKIQLYFPDYSTVSISGSSDFTIKSYIFDAEKREGALHGKIEDGALHFMAGEIKKIAPQNYKIETSTAVIGIRGSSGQVVTTSGKLPDTTPQTVVMKTGGKGITANILGRPPLNDIKKTGSGRIIKEEKPSDVKRFSSSPLTEYDSKIEPRVARGRALFSKKKQEEKEKGEEQLQDEQELLLDEEEEEQEQRFDEEEEEQEEQEQKDMQPLEEEEEPALIEEPVEEESGGHFFSDEEMMNDEVESFMEETFEELDLGEELYYVPEETLDEDPTDRPQEEAFDETIIEDSKETTQKDTQEEVIEVNQTEATEEAITSIADSADDSTDDSTDMTGYYLRENEESGARQILTYNATASRVDGEFTVSYNPVLRAIDLTTYTERLSEGYGGIHYNVPDAHTRLAFDNLEEFYIGNYSVNDESNEMYQTDIFYIGAPNEDIPTSAAGEVMFYGNIFDETDADFERGADLNTAHLTYGEALQQNATIIHADEMFAAVDLHEKTVLGSLYTHTMTPVEGYYGEGSTSSWWSSQNSQFPLARYYGSSFADIFAGEIFDGHEMETLFAADGMPYAVFFADLADDGAISEMHILANIGLLGGQTGTASDSNIYDFRAYEGEGQIYGSEMQGVGVHAANTVGEGALIAAAFAMQDYEDKVSSPDGPYQGMGVGVFYSSETPTSQPLSSDESAPEVVGASGYYNLVSGGDLHTDWSSIGAASGDNVQYNGTSWEVVDSIYEEQYRQATTEQFLLNPTFAVNGNGNGVEATMSFGYYDIEEDENEYAPRTFSAVASSTGSLYNEALSRMHMATTLNDYNSSGVDPTRSFITTMPLPWAVDYSSDGTVDYSVPDDVMWGTWNVVIDEPTAQTPAEVFAGMHNFWVAGKLTGEAYLNVANFDRHYMGGSMRTSALYLDGNDNAPEIVTDGGISAFKVSAETNSPSTIAIEGLIFHPGFELLYINGHGDSDSEYHLIGETAMVSLLGHNEGVYDYSRTSDTFGGFFAGDTGQSLIVKTERGSFEESSNPSVHQSMPGFSGAVAVAKQVTFSDTALSFAGVAHGAWFTSSNDWVSSDASSQLVDVDIDMSVSVDSSGDLASYGLEVENTSSPSSPYAIGSSGTDATALKSYISKNAFVGQVKQTSSVQIGAVSGSFVTDMRNSFIVGIPGLEGFEHISWGVWGIAGESAGTPTGRALGFFGMASDCTSMEIPDVAAILASVSKTRQYGGVAIGQILDSTTPLGQFEMGAVLMNFDFDARTVTGNINFRSDINIGISGILDFTGSDFQGSFGGATTLHGSTVLDGIRGNMVFDEAAGSFKAGDTQQKVIGAFGVKAAQSIPTAAKIHPNTDIH
jgi:hypothetical protein